MVVWAIKSLRGNRFGGSLPHEFRHSRFRGNDGSGRCTVPHPSGVTPWEARVIMWIDRRGH